MRFRRKSDDQAEAAVDPTGEEAVPQEQEEPEEAGASTSGPFDIDDLPGEQEGEWVDLGSLVLANEPGREVRLQVDESTGEVQSVLVAGEDGAVELRAFAAPRGGDLWTQVRPQIAAEFAQRGGTATEREGRFGTELLCQITVRTEDGRTGTQPSRIIGVNGPRWMLRATLLGRPAVEADSSADWEDTIARVVVRRGSQAMPPGSELPVTLPPQARPAGP